MTIYTQTREYLEPKLREVDWQIALAKAKLRCHNKMHGNGGRWLGEIAKLQAYRRRLDGTAPEREEPDFETSVCGIPCGVVVDTYQSGRPWRQHTFPGAGPGDCDPPEPPEAEWHLVNARGYHIPWLEEKMEQEDIRRIESEIFKGEVW